MFCGSASDRQCPAFMQVAASCSRPSTLMTLIRALVISKVDYSILAGISGRQLNRLQSVLNAAARVIFAVSRSEHVTGLLRDLHWLRMPERITFKLCVLVYRCLDARRRPTWPTVPPVFGCRRSPWSLRSAAARTLVVPATRRSSLGDRSFYAAAPRA